MITIKNSEELAKLLDENKDLRIDDDVRIEYQVQRGELRDVYCQNLTLSNDDERFNFNGRDFNGWNFNGGDFIGEDFDGMDFIGENFIGGNFNGRDFTGGDFKGCDFNGWDFNGGDFKGWDFNGWDFNGGDFKGWDFNGENFDGGDVSYYTFFNCYGSITCKSIKGRRNPHNPPVALDGKITITG